MKIHCFPNLGIEEGAEDVETIQDHLLSGGEGQDQIDGLGVDCGCVGVADRLPFQIAESYQSCLALCHVPHGVDLGFEVHLALEQLASAGHL